MVIGCFFWVAIFGAHVIFGVIPTTTGLFDTNNAHRNWILTKWYISTCEVWFIRVSHNTVTFCGTLKYNLNILTYIRHAKVLFKYFNLYYRLKHLNSTWRATECNWIWQNLASMHRATFGNMTILSNNSIIASWCIMLGKSRHTVVCHAAQENGRAQT